MIVLNKFIYNLCPVKVVQVYSYALIYYKARMASYYIEGREVWN